MFTNSLTADLVLYILGEQKAYILIPLLERRGHAENVRGGLQIGMSLIIPL